MPEALTSAVIGALAGFLTSLFFWRKSQRKDRPRLYLKMWKIDQVRGEGYFKIVNEGETHAINIRLDDYPLPDAPSDLGPKAEFALETIGPDDSKEYLLSYFDVWGTKYTAKWYLAGPQKFEVEGGVLYDYAHAEKGYEYQTGGLILRLKKYFSKRKI